MIFAAPVAFPPDVRSQTSEVRFIANAITFAAPVRFDEANVLLEIKSLLPTDMSSGELEDISSDILERAFFSARVTDAEYLQELSDTVDDYLNGKTDLATARLNLKDKLDELKYEPAPDDRGGLKDLSSDARINLQLRMNSQMAAGYGNWMQGQNEALLNSRPAQELYRAFARRVPRNWIKRWSNAGGKFYGGRMIALKNTPIWTAISRFGTPYPPFDFNSGMSIRDIDRKTAMDLGLIDLTTKIDPETRDFNQDLKVSADIRNQALRTVLEDEGYQFKTSEDGTEVLSL